MIESRQLPRIYSVAPSGKPGSHELVAYALAQASRSARPLDEAVAALTSDLHGAEKTEAFFEHNYHGYGHQSIADLAHLVIAVEDTSLLGAMYLVDEPVWDGQERSTRFQAMASGWVNPLVPGTTEAQRFDQVVQETLTDVEAVQTLTEQALAKTYPSGTGAQKRTLTSRARDVSRLLLPLCMKTGVNQVVSARTLSRQIGRLRALALRDGLTELTDIAMALEATGRELAPSLLRHITAPPMLSVRRPWLHDYLPTTITTGGIAAWGMLRASTGIGMPLLEMDLAWATATLPPLPPLPSLVKSAHLWHDPSQLVAFLEGREAREELPRFFAVNDLVFQVQLDLGSYRDLQRHRPLVHVLPPLSGREDHRFVQLADLAFACLGEAEGAWFASGAAEMLAEAAERLFGVAEALNTPYLLPLGTVTRVLFSCDWPELAYITQLRTAPAGHGLYRLAVHRMIDAAKELHRIRPDYNRMRQLYDRALAAVLRNTPMDPADIMARG